MGESLPPLPVRRPVNRAMAATLRYWYTSGRNNRALLERIAAGLRALPDTYSADHCRSDLPIRSYAHAHQVMAMHSEHRCDRYSAAARYAVRVRP
jgi:hypothetical protein